MAMPVPSSTTSYPVVDRRQLRVLIELARKGPVLELGLATGRVATRLASAGLDVHGVEVSVAMLAALRRRAGTERLRVIYGDFTVARCGGPFTLIFALVSTLALLPHADLQQRCLHNVVAHLAPGGLFLNESFETCPGRVPAEQAHRLRLADGLHTYRVTTLPLPSADVDALARRAGLVLIARWSDWARTPCGPDSARQIAVYGRA